MSENLSEDAGRNVLLLDEKLSYGFGSCMVQAMACCFRSRGYNPIIVNLAAPDLTDNLHTLFSDRDKFSFAFSMGRGLAKDERGKCIHDYFGIPLFAAFGDHPLFKYDFIDFEMDSVVYGFNDPGHVAFCKSKLGSDRYVHFPHFGFIPSMMELTEAEFSQRQKSLFFPAGAAIMARQWSTNASGVNDSQILNELEQRGVKISLFVEEFVERGNHLDADLSLFLEAHINRIGALDIRNFAKVFREVDVLVRALRRQRIVRALDGLPLTVIGDRWDKCNYLGKSVTVLKPVGYLECEAIRRRYQLTLHTSQLQPNASHDRVLHAMSAGQAVLGERTPYLETEARRGYIELFSIDKNDVATSYAKLLDDDSRRFQMCRAALDASISTPRNEQAIADMVIDALEQRGLLRV
jgi:hypothetical protein